MALTASVITVCHNSVDYIEDTIRSVLSQKAADVDYVVIDGQSTDGTVDIIRRYSNDIAYWASEPDGSMYEAMNKGLEAAQGDIVGIVNSDDRLYDEYTIHDVIKAFEAHPDADGIYGDKVKEIGSRQHYRRVFQVDYFDYLVSGKGTFVPHGSLFVRRSLIEKLNGYDATFRFASDYDFILRALSMGTLKYIPMPICRFRIHQASITSSGRLPAERDAILTKHGREQKVRVWNAWRGYVLWTKYKLLQALYRLLWPLARAKRARQIEERNRNG